jgi:hypothetical protein
LSGLCRNEPASRHIRTIVSHAGSPAVADNIIPVHVREALMAWSCCWAKFEESPAGFRSPAGRFEAGRVQGRVCDAASDRIPGGAVPGRDVGAGSESADTASEQASPIAGVANHLAARTFCFISSSI